MEKNNILNQETLKKKNTMYFTITKPMNWEEKKTEIHKSGT